MHDIPIPADCDGDRKTMAVYRDGVVSSSNARDGEVTYYKVGGPPQEYRLSEYVIHQAASPIFAQRVSDKVSGTSTFMPWLKRFISAK